MKKTIKPLARIDFIRAEIEEINNHIRKKEIQIHDAQVIISKLEVRKKELKKKE